MHRNSFPIVVLLLGLAPLSESAAVPRPVGYQGRLLRSDGTAATGTTSVTFSLFSAENGGAPLWSETQTLGLSDGYYATFLGLVAPQPDGLFDGTGRWLEVRVGAETLSPRQQIGSIPHAIVASSVAGGSAAVTSLQVGAQTVIDQNGRLAGPARYAAGSGIVVDDATQTLSLPACPAGQTLVRDASTWQCVAPNPGTVTRVDASAPLSVVDGSSSPVLSMTQSGSASSGYLSSPDWSLFAAKYGAQTQCGGDLSGLLAAPVVARLQSRAVAATPPAAGQVLKWNASSSQWEPSADLDSGGTLTAVTAVAPLTAQTSATSVQLSVAPASASTDGCLASGDWARFDAKYDSSTQCTGDLAGTYLSPQVAKLQGVGVDPAAPAQAQLLRFDGSRWAPASLLVSDVGGLSSGYLDLTGAQSIGGAKTFTAAPVFGTPLGVASGGTGTGTAPAGTVFAGPAAAPDAQPGFRALAASDIPALDMSKVSTGTLGVTQGGTGATALSGVVHGSGAGVLTAGLVGLESEVSGTLPVGSGGTGATALSGVVHGSGTGVLTAGLVGLGSEVSGTLPVGHGGTGATALTGVVHGSGTGALTAGLVGLGSEVSGTLPVGNGGTGASTFTTGSVVFADASGVYSQNNAKLFWDDSNARLGLGTASPNSALEIANGGIRFSGSGGFGSGSDSGIFGDGGASGTLNFVTAGTRQAIIDSNGNVGLGTTTPGAKLDVAGALRVRGVTLDPTFRHDDGIYWAPQSFFEAGQFPYSLGGGTAPTFVTVNSTSPPFGKVALSAGYVEFAADFVPVQAGETLYGEIWAMRQTGSTGTAGAFYFGVAQSDKDKRDVAGNLGLSYFVAGGVTVAQNSTWTKYSGTITLASSHAPYNGSDGGPVRYVRPYVIVNYTSGTIPTYWGGAVIRRLAPYRDAGAVSFNGKVREFGNDLLPRGVITMWSGTLATIPAGWALCDGGTYTSPAGGSVATPDLRGRFIYGTAASENPGATGGAPTHTHTYSQVPNHTHPISDPGHTHWVSSAPRDDGNGTGCGQQSQKYGLWADAGSWNQWADNWGPGSAGAYVQSVGTGISIQNPGGGVASGTTDSSSFLPPYYKLAYIMKL